VILNINLSAKLPGRAKQMVHGPGHSPFVSVSIVTKYFFEFHVQAVLDYYKAVAAQLMDHLQKKFSRHINLITGSERLRL